MKNKLQKNKCAMCGIEFIGNGVVCSQECDKKITEMYSINIPENNTHNPKDLK